MDNTDISLPVTSGKFNFRVGAIIFNADRVLLVNNTGSAHYYSVGGRVRFGESVQEAVLREVHEETGVILEIDRLAYIHENFFFWGQDRVPFHELAFFYLMKESKQVNNKIFENLEEDYGTASFHWLPFDKLDDILMFPDFFKTELRSLRQDDTRGVRHFVTKNNTTTRMS